MICRWFRRRPARPSREALEARTEVEKLRPRVENLVRERDRLLGENNYTARIRALYEAGIVGSHLY